MGQLFLGVAFKVLALIGALTLAFYVGTSFGSSALEPPTIEVKSTELSVECQLVERHTVQYIERPVTVVNNIERVHRIPTELRNFNDLEELKQWLATVDTDTATVYFQLPDVPVDCDDYALALQSKALADGYILSFAVISRNEYDAVFQSELPPSRSLHAINLAVTGNSAYYIEPQTGEIAFAVQLD